MTTGELTIEQETSDQQAESEGSATAPAVEPHVGGRHRAAKPSKPGKAPKPSKRSPTSKIVNAGPVGKSASPARRFVALFVVVGLTVVPAVTAYVLHRSATQAKALAADRTSALAAANHDVQDILGYDYRSISSDINTAKSDSTGQLLTDYTATAQKLLSEAPSIKAIVKATVSAQSVVRAQSDRVTVLMFIDQESVRQLTGEKTPSTRIDPLRVQLTMSKVHGHWLMSDLQPV